MGIVFAMADSEDAASLKILKFAKPSMSATRSEGKDVNKIALMLELYLDRRAKAWIKGQAHSPILFQYGNDSTPMRVMSYRDIVLEVGKVYRRPAKSPHDFLMEKGYFKSFN